MTVTVKSVTQVDKLQKQIDFLQNKISELQSTIESYTSSVTAKVEKSVLKVDANVALMDDVLTHTNSVITFWVGWGTVFIGVIAIFVTVYISNRSKSEIKKLMEDALASDDIKNYLQQELNKYFKTDYFKKLTVGMFKANEESINIEIQDLNIKGKE